MTQAGLPALLGGKTAVITGGTRGIGLGIAEVFAAAGASLMLTGRDTGAGQRAVAAMEAAGAKAWFCAADMRDQATVRAAVAAATEQLGGIDILVQNAGVYPEMPIEQMTADDWDLVHHTNLRGTFFAVQACIPAMRARGGGRIVLISSITGVRTGYPGLAHYGATKAGVNGFMRSAALELAPYGITINAVEPGSIQTEGLAALGAPAIAAMEECIPLRRLGQPAEIGTAALFLASDLASYITGQSIVVDGGQTLPEIKQ
jgi:3-oxoacyl-[acyl-carrier protein] reductase